MAESEGNTDFWSDVSNFETDTEVEEIDVTNDMFTLNIPGNTKYLIDKEMMRRPLGHVSDTVFNLFSKFGQFKYRKSDWKALGLDKKNLETTKLIKYKNDSYYYGQLRKGTDVKEGRGVFVTEDGSLYEGFWKHGKQYGKGRMIYTSNAIYQGDWKSGEYHGLGIYIDCDSGGMRKSQHKKGKAHGEGIELWPDGTTYKGQYKAGQKAGYGIFKWADGTHYQGGMKNDMLEGLGTLDLADGRKYEGTFKESKMHGEGTFTWPDGKKYVGAYVDGKKHGMGKLQWPDGKEYFGEWIDGKVHGEAMFKDEKGRKSKHLIDKGKFKKQFTKLF